MTVAKAVDQELTVTSRGQVTLRQSVLQDLQIVPGDKLRLRKLPDGTYQLLPSRATKTWDDFVGCLAGKTDVVATDREIKESIEDAWINHKELDL